MCRNSIVTILRLALCWPLVVGTAVAANISVTSTFELFPTCDATAGVGSFTTPDSVQRDWTNARDYCSHWGLRLPTKNELVDLYSAYPNNQIERVCGWPTNVPYWSSTESSDPGYHYRVYLSDGIVGETMDSYLGLYVTCVR